MILKNLFEIKLSMKNQKLIDDLRSDSESRRNKVIKYLIKETKNQLRSLILKNFSVYKANLDDVMSEVISEAYVRLMKRVEEPEFKIEKSLGSYFLVICKYYLYEKVRADVKVIPTDQLDGQQDEFSLEYLDGSIELTYELLEKLINQLDEKCAKILKYKYYSIKEGKKARTTQEVADFFSYTEKNARKTISACRKKLNELFKQQFKP